jgi:DNA-binding NarL/FixJ family response regulator
MLNEIKIMLVDDQNLYLESVKMVLETQEDFKVVGIVKSGREAIERFEEINPDIILMDISMSEIDGIDASEIILDRNKDQKIILVSSYSSRSYVSKALQLGVSAYVVKDEGINELIDAIRNVMNNGEYYSQNVTKTITSLYRKKEYLEKNIVCEKLTNLEIDVFREWAYGKQVKESADILNMSQSTVEKHRQRIRQKLNFTNSSDVTLIAVKEGIIRLEDIPK